MYLRDSGILHSLLDLPDRDALLGYPRVGASWEGFAIEQVLLAIRPSEAYYWGTHTGAELDLFFMANGRRFGIEATFNEAPTATRSMRTALDDLSLDHLWVVYPGHDAYPMDDRISVCPLRAAGGLPTAIARLSRGGRTSA